MIKFLLPLIYLTYGCSFTSEDDLNGVSDPRPEATTHEMPAPDVAPIRVEAAMAKLAELTMHLSATGLTRSAREAALLARVSGEVVGLVVEEGQMVKQGEPVILFDDRDQQLALAEARDELLGALIEFVMMQQESRFGTNSSGADSMGNRANSGLALTNPEPEVTLAEFDSIKARCRQQGLTEATFNRAGIAYESALILLGRKRDEVLAHTSGLTRAQLAVNRAELSLSRTKILAPFTGYAANIEVQEGQHVSAGETCLKLIDLSAIDVDLHVLESEVVQLRKGCAAEVSFPTYPRRRFSGHVITINPHVDSKTKAVRVTVRMDEVVPGIFPGMFANARVHTETLRNRLLVPQTAILVRDSRKLIFVIRRGFAKWCYVQTGAENGHFVEILDSGCGLEAGEPVITSGHYTLIHDAKVRLD